MKGKHVKTVLMMVAVLLGLYVGYMQIKPQVALPKDFKETGKTLDQADEGPDLDLMLSHLKAMASQVHSVGSEGLRITQAYLIDQLEQLGHTPVVEEYVLSAAEIQALEAERIAYHRQNWHADDLVIREYSSNSDKLGMNLKNIYVALDAPGTDEAILFMAHTDSVIMGPGAFDDTVSVAAMLEGIRALNGVPLKCDMIFLFTDGEEKRLLGAALFVNDHPELKDRVQSVINLEGRGNRGALIMFESTHNNLNMVRAYARSAPGPLALSVANSVYRMMDNDTDLTRFIMAGYSGMNLAVIEGAEVYHTKDDNYENFDRKSAMHYLATVTGLATDFATCEDLTLTAREDGVFFPLWPGNLMVMSRTLADVLAFAALVAYVVVLVILVLCRRVRMLRVLHAAVASLLALAVAGGLAFGLLKILDAIPAVRDSLGASQGIAEQLACAVLAFAALPVFRFIYRKGDGTAAALGTLLLPALLAPVMVFLFPSASYLFSWPVLLGLVSVLVHPWCRLGIVPAAMAFISLLLYVPLAALVMIALGVQVAYVPVVLTALPLVMAVGQWRMGKVA
ncbi:MAG: M20/M25/M40 family metallo-hydrolase [Christensenellales bacterium]|jgi:Zn-dependent M28 family amino/carboxypeptidase